MNSSFSYYLISVEPDWIRSAVPYAIIVQAPSFDSYGAKMKALEFFEGNAEDILHFTESNEKFYVIRYRTWDGGIADDFAAGTSPEDAFENWRLRPIADGRAEEPFLNFSELLDIRPAPVGVVLRLDLTFHEMEKYRTKTNRNPSPELKKKSISSYKWIGDESAERRNAALERQLRWLYIDRRWGIVVKSAIWRALGSGKHWVGFFVLVFNRGSGEFHVDIRIESGKSWGQAERALIREADPRRIRKKAKGKDATGAGPLDFLRWCLKAVQISQGYLFDEQDELASHTRTQLPITLRIFGSDDRRDRAYAYLKRLGFQEEMTYIGPEYVWTTDMPFQRFRV